MKKTCLAATLLLLSLAATACGNSTATARASGNTAVNNTATGNGPSTKNSTTNNTTALNTSSPSLQLTPFTAGSASGISVYAPAGWTASPISGGDYRGWKLVNPNDSNQQEVVVTSSCVGCSTAPDGSTQAQQVVPEKNAQIVSTTNNNRTVEYSYTLSGNPNQGIGKVVVSSDQSGYAYVEIVLPSSEQSVASQVLNSFQLTR